MLEKHGFRRAIIGYFIRSVIRKLRDLGRDYPLSILVSSVVDPVLAAKQSGADGKADIQPEGVLKDYR